MEVLYRDSAARLSDVAWEIGVSSEAIRREFRRRFGDSPMHYFTSFRVASVAQILADSDRPLRDLAEQFGFYDEFHLSRVFRRHVGVSPSEYRARHRV
jgi:transcriptional regulator GlxA family with amidase domain